MDHDTRHFAISAGPWSLEFIRQFILYPRTSSTSSYHHNFVAEEFIGSFLWIHRTIEHLRIENLIRVTVKPHPGCSLYSLETRDQLGTDRLGHTPGGWQLPGQNQRNLALSAILVAEN